MIDFRVPLSVSVSQDTLRFVDKFKVSQSGKLSRGEVFDLAVAALKKQEDGSFSTEKSTRKSGKAS